MIRLLQAIGFRPLYCVWELTLVCDLRCKHCGSYAGASRGSELSLEECARVVDSLAELGCIRLTLSGGEPTLHPHWHEIGRRASDAGIAVNLISNGWSWSGEQLERAREARVTNVGFSLDGFEDAHDEVRRPGSFRRVVAALDLCARQGMATAVVTHINRLNLHSLPALRQLLGDHGVEHWQVQLGIPEGHMRSHLDLLIEPAELLWLVPQIAALRSEQGAKPLVCPAHNVGYYGSCEQAIRAQGSALDVWVGCRAGCQVLGIESNGNVKGCLSLPSARHGDEGYVVGNLRDEPLEEMWRRPDAFVAHRRFEPQQLGGFCAVCRYGDMCRGGCTWTAQGRSGERFDNHYCLYRQAVLHRRFDLLGDDRPNEAELRATAARPDVARASVSE